MLRNRFWLVASLGLLAGLLPGASLPAAEFRAKDKVTVAKDEVIEDDLYAAGDVVTIEGTIKGDLIVAGRSIEIKGTVEGDLIAAGQGVLIEGRVEDDARVAGMVLKVAESGYVGGDLLGAGMSLEAANGSNITADTIFAGMQALLAGKVGRNVLGALHNCQIDGEIGGNVWLHTDPADPVPPQAFQGQPPPIPFPEVARGLNVGQNAKIGGKLTYQSVAQAAIADEKAIAGGVEYKAIVPKVGAPQKKPGLEQMALGRLKNLAAVALVGLVTVLLLPRWTSEMAANLRYRPLLSIVGGLVGFIGFLILLVLIVGLMIAAMILFGGLGLEDLSVASLGLGVFGSISLVGLLWFATAFLAPTLVCVYFGRLIGRSPAFPTLAAFLIGLVLVAILWAIPYAGWWIALVIIWLGFGAFCVWLVSGPPEDILVVRAATVPVAKR